MLQSAPAATEEHPEVEEGEQHRQQGIGNWTLLLVVFVFFRLMAVFFLTPGGRFHSGGIDLLQYRRLGELSLDGYYPFLHYWFEYPPIFPWVSVGLYRLTLLLPPAPSDLVWFQAFLGMFLLAFDAGNLVLIYRLSSDLGGRSRGLRSALLYAGLFLPLYSILNWFDVFPLFFLLLAIRLTAQRRAWLAGVATGLGVMVKVLPLVVAPAALRYFRTRERVGYVLAIAASTFAVALPFLWHDPKWLLAGFQATLDRSSWETIWSLAEGYTGFGEVGPFSTRFDPAAASFAAHPATLPWPLINAAFLAACLLLVWRRPSVALPRSVPAAVALTLNLFLIFAKGYSPQFLVYPLAMLAVLLPDGWGLAYGILLVVSNFVEYPLYYVLFGDQQWMLAGTIVTRTALLSLLCVEYATLLFPRRRSSWLRLRRTLAPVVVLSLGAAVVLSIGLLVNRSTLPGHLPAAVGYIRPLFASTQGLVASSRDAFYQLKPYFRDDAFLLAPSDDEPDSGALERRLASFSAGKSGVWVILDRGHDDEGTADRLAAWFDRWGGRSTDRWFGSWQLLGYLPYSPAASDVYASLDSSFAGQLRLTGYRLSRQELAPGDGFQLALAWRVERPPDKDYKVFVHLLLADSGRTIAQSDRPLTYLGKGSSSWTRGNLVLQGYDVTVPNDAPPGAYLLAVGIYDPDGGQRSPVADPSGARSDKVVVQTISIRH